MGDGFCPASFMLASFEHFAGVYRFLKWPVFSLLWCRILWFKRYPQIFGPSEMPQDAERAAGMAGNCKPLKTQVYVLFVIGSGNLH